jgi:hypothetical protein
MKRDRILVREEGDVTSFAKRFKTLSANLEDVISRRLFFSFHSKGEEEERHPSLSHFLFLAESAGD